MDFEDKMLAILPHGSGINYDWNIERTANTVICRNKWDNMNEQGLYDDVFPFSVTFCKEDFTVKFHGLKPNQYRKIRWNGLRDFLEDTFALVFDDVKKVMEG